MKHRILILLTFVTSTAFAQKELSKNEFSINAFRAPSIGIEYRRHSLSYHGGYYLTAFGGETNNFIKAGVTYWFAPVGKKENPSSFYGCLSYLRGLDMTYKDKNALGAEAGFRWMIWKGLNLRIGVITVAASGETLKLNPAGGLSYSFFF